MATTVTGAATQGATAIAEERVKLRKVLRRFDLICFTIAALIALDTIASTAAYGGGETLFWVGFVIILYLIPSGLICAANSSSTSRNMARSGIASGKHWRKVCNRWQNARSLSV